MQDDLLSFFSLTLSWQKRIVLIIIKLTPFFWVVLHLKFSLMSEEQPREICLTLQCCMAELLACAQTIHWLMLMMTEAGQIRGCNILESEYRDLCISLNAGISTCAFATLNLRHSKCLGTIWTNFHRLISFAHGFQYVCES